MENSTSVENAATSEIYPLRPCKERLLFNWALTILDGNHPLRWYVCIKGISMAKMMCDGVSAPPLFFGELSAHPRTTASSPISPYYIVHTHRAAHLHTAQRRARLH